MLFLDVTEREATQAKFILEVRTKLQMAYVQAKHVENATLQSLADKLEINRSVVFRHLNGESNPTIKTIADLAWAIGKEPFFDLRDKNQSIVKTSSKLSDYRNIVQRAVFDATPKDRVVTSKTISSDSTGTNSETLQVA